VPGAFFLCETAAQHAPTPPMPCNCSSRDIDFVLKMQKKACQASLCITPSKGLSNEVPGAFFRCETAAQHAPTPPMPCNCSSSNIDFVLKMQKMRVRHHCASPLAKGFRTRCRELSFIAHMICATREYHAYMTNIIY